MWQPKTTTIREARNLKTLAWDELLGILRVHEVHPQNRDHLPNKDFASLKSVELATKKKKRIAFLKLLKCKWLIVQTIMLKNPQMMKWLSCPENSSRC